METENKQMESSDSKTMDASDFEALAGELTRENSPSADSPLKDETLLDVMRSAERSAERVLSGMTEADRERLAVEGGRRFSDILPLGKASSVKIALVGAGGIGNWVWRVLVGMGFTNLAIVDFDTVGPENVGPQSHYLSDIGEAKVDAVSRQALLYRGVRIGTYNVKLESGYDSLVQTLGYVPDVVIGATDSAAWRNEAIGQMNQKFLSLYGMREDLPELFVDLRMSLGQWNAFAFPYRALKNESQNLPGKLKKDKLVERYEKMAVFDPSEAVQEPCTARAIGYTGANVASYVGALLHWWTMRGRYELEREAVGLEDWRRNVERFFSGVKEDETFGFYYGFSSCDWDSTVPSRKLTEISDRSCDAEMQVLRLSRARNMHLSVLARQLGLPETALPSSENVLDLYRHREGILIGRTPAVEGGETPVAVFCDGLGGPKSSVFGCKYLNLETMTEGAFDAGSAERDVAAGDYLFVPKDGICLYRGFWFAESWASAPEHRAYEGDPYIMLYGLETLSSVGRGQPMRFFAMERMSDLRWGLHLFEGKVVGDRLELSHVRELPFGEALKSCDTGIWAGTMRFHWVANPNFRALEDGDKYISAGAGDSYRICAMDERVSEILSRAVVYHERSYENEEEDGSASASAVDGICTQENPLEIERAFGSPCDWKAGDRFRIGDRTYLFLHAVDEFLGGDDVCRVVRMCEGVVAEGSDAESLCLPEDFKVMKVIPDTEGELEAWRAMAAAFLDDDDDSDLEVSVRRTGAGDGYSEDWDEYSENLDDEDDEDDEDATYDLREDD